MDDAKAVTQNWVESIVVNLNLCPFAWRELDSGRVRLINFSGDDESGLLQALQDETELLDRDTSIETTLLIHPFVLQDFDKYNQFLNLVDDLIVDLRREGVYQVASFHPQYQFAGTDPDAPENYTNRSPFPMLHLLREASVEKAIESYPDVEKIPERNIECMNDMGKEKLDDLLRSCRHSTD
ncbi:MAG: DUF1415 domain-containing protein [Woeseiaceae bacterium]|nr:DUF1415 domain-containing protein [Woeseiaceae bacterium]